jgi:hypothetical protein
VLCTLTGSVKYCFADSRKPTFLLLVNFYYSSRSNIYFIEDQQLLRHHFPVHPQIPPHQSMISAPPENVSFLGVCILFF